MILPGVLVTVLMISKAKPCSVTVAEYFKSLLFIDEIFFSKSTTFISVHISTGHWII